MQVRHNSGPENGPQHTPISNLIPRNARNPQTQAGDPPSDLVGFLRWWAGHHNWYELGYIRNRLKLERAFAEPISNAVTEYMATRQTMLAEQIRTEFDNLLGMAQEFDRICRLGCSYENEYKVCQHIRGRLKKMLEDLADLLEIKPAADTNAAVNDSGGASENTRKKAPKTKWMTFGKTAKLLGISKSTVSKWAENGRFSDNGLKGQKRRLSKASVLLVKQDIDDEYLNGYAEELQGDTGRIR